MMASLAKAPTEFLCNESLKRFGYNLNLLMCCFYTLQPVRPGKCLMRLIFVATRYEMQDLHVAETLPQMVALSETYIQIYEQQQGGGQ